MNIFFLDRDPGAAARLHSDVHVTRMVLETAQILCSALHRHGLPAPYRPTHARHPSVLWAGDSLAHYRWLRNLGLALADEYRYRRGREHASEKVIRALPEAPTLPDAGWTDPPQSMPEEFRKEDTIAAYRAYYAGAKAEFKSKGPAGWCRNS